MNSSTYFTLLNPAASLVFSVTFFGLWAYQRSRPYLGMLGVTYLLSATGFLLQVLVLPVGEPATRVLSNIFFVSATLTMATAVGWRYGRRIPYELQLSTGFAGLTCIVWFWFIEPSLIMRVYSISFAIGAMLLLVAWQIARVENKSFVDKLLLSMFTLQGVVFFARTIAMVKFGGLQDQGDLHNSPFWMIFTFSHLIASMVVVFTLLLDAAVDTVQALKAESKTDPLSGLLNRRGFEAAAINALEMADGRPKSLILGDLDLFKSINDNFGHETGDRVIVTFASVLRKMVRTDHPIGRVGGEEFAILAIGLDVSTARLMAEGVRVGFTSAPTPGRLLGASRRLTSSFGVAEHTAGESYTDLLNRADKALYMAKHEGRDRVRIAESARYSSGVGLSQPYPAKG